MNTTTKPIPPVVTVPVTSAWASKINWTQVIGLGISGATYALGLLPPQYAAIGAIAIQTVQSVATWYFKTFATTSVTPASVLNSTLIPTT